MADLKWTPPPTASAGDILRAAARVLDVAEKERMERLARSEVLAGMPTPEAFRKALRMAQGVYLDRHPPRYVNSDQADASDSEAATELQDCYRAALSALGVPASDAPKRYLLIDGKMQEDEHGNWTPAVQPSQAPSPTFDYVWSLVQRYADATRYPINGPDPSGDAAKATLQSALRAIVAAGVQEASGLAQQLATAVEAIEADHDPLCMAVLRGKACTCGVRGPDHG